MEQEPSCLADCVIKVTPPLASNLDCSKAHPKYYAFAIYTPEGKLKDDGLSVDNERSYWESFIDPTQAKELERRLTLVESEDYIPGSLVFDQMPEHKPDKEEDD